MIKLRRTRLAGHVAHIEKKKCIQGFGEEIRCLTLLGDVSMASF